MKPDRSALMPIRQASWLVFILVALGVPGCDSPGNTNGTNDAALIEVTILYTNDEHGWMLGTEDGRGAAEMVGLWESQEGYTPDGPFLILSGGDMWTGPAISTWFQGESMAEVMNAMGYAAGAIGNHEFDFQVEGLNARLAESNFPYLSANIRLKGTDAIPIFATPYLVKEVAGLKIGIIGLTTTSTPEDAFPAYVADFDFIDYETALQEIMPDLESQNPDIIVVIAHVCETQLNQLAATAKSLGISVLAGGHCHYSYNQLQNGVTIIQAGSYLRNYARIVLKYDQAAGKLESVTTTLHTNSSGTPNAALASIINRWQAQSDAILGEVIGYSSGGLSQYDPALRNLIPDSWLWYFTEADMAATNYGGIRQDLPAGNISIDDVVGVLPFTNSLYILDLNGQDIMNFVSTNLDVAIGGLTAVGAFFHPDGTPVKADSIYQFIVTDFMYTSSTYGSLPIGDSQPVMTGLSWRQPLIEMLRDIGSTADQPLEGFIDQVQRR